METLGHYYACHLLRPRRYTCRSESSGLPSRTTASRVAVHPVGQKLDSTAINGIEGIMRASLRESHDAIEQQCPLHHRGCFSFAGIDHSAARDAGSPALLQLLGA